MPVSYLAEFRKALGMSLEELSNRSGIDVDTVQEWEEKGIPGSALATELYYYSVALKSSVSIVAHFSNLQKDMVSKWQKQMCFFTRYSLQFCCSYMLL